jgi:hypothetical protein
VGKSAIDWVSDKLVTKEQLEVRGRTPEGFLLVKSPTDGYTFRVAVLGVQTVIEHSDVQPLFAGANKPQFVVNVPSKALWSGAAIDYIHAAPAAFGKVGDVSRAAGAGNVATYRDKKMGFFIDAMTQHENVSRVSYVFDSVFKADRIVGRSLIVAVIDAYNMSAEDVRNARARVGDFDVVVKSTSHGSITAQAAAAAKSMAAEALTFGELMQRLRK